MPAVGFHLTYAQALADARGTLFGLGGVGLAILSLAAVMWFVAKPHVRRMMSFATGSVGLILLALVFLTPISLAGAGWTASGGRLVVASGFGSVNWPLTQVHTEWVDKEAGYRPLERIGGYGGANLQAGHFVLANGQHALLFVGRGGAAGWPAAHPRWLLVTNTANRQVVLLSTPNLPRLQQAVAQAQADPSAVSSRNGASVATFGWVLRVAQVVVNGLVAVVAVAVQIRLARRYGPHLPEVVASHWGIRGEVDGSMSKRAMLRLWPVLAIGMGVLAVGISCLPGTLVAALPFCLLQVLFVVLARWVYRQNVDGPR